MQAIEVGNRFLNYYQNLGYQVIPGSSLLDDSVPMSFVMSAGMVQFEKLAGKSRDSNHYTLIQNCFRYFDIEQVGDSAYHLSLFQMPATFDFGPVERAKTVRQIWQLLTHVYGLAPQNLAVTCSGGGEIASTEVPADEETLQAWLSLGLSSSQIYRLPAPENFWRQHATNVGVINSRKCGLTTEVFFDLGQHLACGPDCRPGCKCGRFVELLNTLFITLRVAEDNETFLPLEEPFTETVIGLERMAAILQKAPSVYEIDTLRPLLLQTRLSECASILLESDRQKYERILVDHLRALLFLTADGAPPPGRGGRARLMRILTRELLASQRLLGISDPGFLRVLLRMTAEIFPQLAAAQTKTLERITRERLLFERTLQRGLRALEVRLTLHSNRPLAGTEILAMEKQQGIPFSLLKYHCWRKGFSFDEEGYLKARKNFERTNSPGTIGQATNYA